MRRRVVLVVASFLAAASIQARSLSWNRMDVVAVLDADGRLHASETLAYLFDGDWNGGERSFNLRTGQTLQIEGVDRIDQGQAVPLVNGDVSKVDHYELMSRNVLRWRSRLPDDPPFDHREITYRIRYTLAGVLRKDGSTYRLSHDFAFPNRTDLIRNFTLKLTVDPAWGGTEPVIAISRPSIAPGQGVVVERALSYRGAGKPGAVVTGISTPVSMAFAGLLLAGLLAAVVRFALRERAWGRFAPLVDLNAIDDAWLSRHVFSIPPEVASAAAADSVGPKAVAATLARMTQEKKISTSIEKPHAFGAPVLHMKLLVRRDSLQGYEALLIKTLFFGDRTETDIATLRSHYKSTGLDLAALIRKGIDEQTAKLPKWNSKKPRAKYRNDVIFLGVAVAAMIAAAFQGGNDTGVVAGLFLFGVPCTVAASLAAALNCDAVSRLLLRFTLVAVLMLPVLVLAVAFLLKAGTYLMHLPTMAAIVIAGVALMNLVLDLLRTPEAPEKIAFRKLLLSARRYFAWQLRQPSPRLRDEWYPYLLAFGLGPHVDQWFRSEGAAALASTSSARSTSSGGGESGGGGLSWTGGGGAFGGAGASGGWAVAIGALSSGVSAPASSSGGSGGGGGGGSSGGGGGGGW